MLALTGALLLLVVAGFVTTTSSEPPVLQEARREGLPAELERALLDVHRAWKPAERTTLIAAAGPLVLLHAAPLLRLLDRPDHALFRAAVDVSVAHAVDGARASLRALVLGEMSGGAAAVAIRAVEALAPWSQAELDGLFAHAQREVVLAALAVAGDRGQPFPAVLPLLQHDDVEIRAAALCAIPEGAEALRDDLIARTGAHDRPLVEVVRALGKTGLVPAVEDVLNDLLGHTDPGVRQASLDALASKPAPLRRPDAVWMLVAGTHDPIEQARGMRALERTKSATAADVQRHLPALHPYARYFAARCLVAAGERDGVGVLIDLLELDGAAFAGAPPEKVGAALLTVRQFLARAARTGTYADPSVWRVWYGGLASISAQTLADPGS